MSLKISYGELRRYIGRHLAYARSPTSWDTDQTQDVDDILSAAQRQVYWPLAMDGTEMHTWSFLIATGELSLVSGTREYGLPDGFVRLVSNPSYKSDAGVGQLDPIPEEQIRSIYSNEVVDGLPRYYSVRSRATTATVNDGYEMLLHPQPDAAKTLVYRYVFDPDALSSNNEHHLGPAAHSELLISACLMVADKMLNGETVGPEGGLHATRFREQLAAAIALDRKIYEAT